MFAIFTVGVRIMAVFVRAVAMGVAVGGMTVAMAMAVVMIVVMISVAVAMVPQHEKVDSIHRHAHQSKGKHHCRGVNW